MRQLKLTYALTQRGLPVLVAAALSPAAGCGGDTDRDLGASTSDGIGGTQTGGSGNGFPGGAGSGGGVIVASGGTTGGAAGAGSSIDPRYEFTDGGAGGPTDCLDWNRVLVVELPPEGTPADPVVICADPQAVLSSGWAARVTLTHAGRDSLSAVGRIEIASALSGRVIGVPQLTSLPTNHPILGAVQFSNMREDGDGFAFDATWTDGDPIPYSGQGTLTLLIAFQVSCEEEGQPFGRQIEVTNTLHLCGDLMFSDSPVWVSPGDDCAECPAICEMAPSPIVPEPREEDLPLASALRLGMRLVARLGNSLVLLAEHDGGDAGVAYRWQASGGSLHQLAPDVVVWNPPRDGEPHQLQVAAETPGAAAIASYRCDRAA